jgi:hypothetical protein
LDTVTCAEQARPIIRGSMPQTLWVSFRVPL